MRRVIFNQKGGVGKSTITCNLAAISAHYGQRTLVVDLDPQSNSTQYLLGRKADTIQPTIGDYYSQILDQQYSVKRANDFIHLTPFKNLFVLPASPILEQLQTALETQEKIFKLRSLLDAIDPFDAIFIDTPPALNFYTQSALIASDTCLIPFDCDLFSRNAIYHLLRGGAQIRKDYNAGLRVEGVIVNQYQPLASWPTKLVDELKAEGLPVIPTFLSASVKIRESHDAALPMIHFAPKHKVTNEFIQIYKTLKTYEISQPDALNLADTLNTKKSVLEEEAQFEMI